MHGAGTYGLSDEVIEAIAQFARPGFITAEAGAGISTIVLVGLGTHHLAITPTKDEAAKIQAWLSKHQLLATSLRFDHRLSWDALPTCTELGLDFALIDGCHGFPAPFLDFFYLSRNLKVGGVLAIDDVQIWTGRILVEFLKAEISWEFLRQVDKTAFFRKVRELEWNEWEWDRQPFVVKRSQPSLAQRAMWFLDIVRRALGHLLRGDRVKLKRGIALIFGRKKR